MATRMDPLNTISKSCDKIMPTYKCEQCWWTGTIETVDSAADDAVEVNEIEFCPVCGEWGI